MSFDTGIPNIRVIIREVSDENLTVDVPNISVNVQQGSQYNVNLVPTAVTILRTGSFNTYADVAGHAETASVVTNITLTNVAPVSPQTGSVYFSSSFFYVYNGTKYLSASLS